MDVESQTLAALIGSALRAHRQRSGHSMDALAQRCRRLGNTMSASSIQSIEEGASSTSLGSLLTLTMALGELTGTPLRLTDLLSSPEPADAAGHARADTAEPAVHLTTKHAAPVTVSLIHDALSGQPVTAPVDLCVDEEHNPAIRSLGSLCERRSAKQLNIAVPVLRATATRLWGHGLEEQITVLSNPLDSPQQRGHITRALLAELYTALSDEELDAP